MAEGFWKVSSREARRNIVASGYSTLLALREVCALAFAGAVQTGVFFTGSALGGTDGAPTGTFCPCHRAIPKMQHEGSMRGR